LVRLILREEQMIMIHNHITHFPYSDS
jgi:hypothetical protein